MASGKSEGQGVRQRARDRDRQYIQQHPCWSGGQGAEAPAGIQYGLVPVAGQFNEISRDFHELVKFTTKNHQHLVSGHDAQSPCKVLHGAYWSHLLAHCHRRLRRWLAALGRATGCERRGTR